MKQKYCFQILTENRNYVLATKSEYDMTQWYHAIQGQIILSKDNQNIADINRAIFLKEKEFATEDMNVIRKIFNPKHVIFNPTQPILLDFINDPFINELLPNLTKYVSLASDKKYQRHALDKAKDIMQQLSLLLKKVERSLEPEQSHTIDEESKAARMKLTESPDGISITISGNEQAANRLSSRPELLAVS